MSGIDRTATMTTNSAPSPNVVSASTELGAGNEAFRAFDKLDSQWITASVTTGIIKYDFGSGNTWACDEYKLEPQTSARMCKDWTFEGSNDNANWTVLDTRTNQTTWTTGVKVDYTFSNTTRYRYYRLNVTANNGDSTYLEIDEINIYAPNNESSSVSPSVSPSASTSPSSSASRSNSASISPSSSASLSSSSSGSASSSASLSPSGSTSSSASASPSQDFEDYTRQEKAALPSNDTDLTTVYTTQEKINVSTYDGIRVGQTGSQDYMIHQFKLFRDDTDPTVLCRGRSTLAPSLSPVYLQIYNQSTGSWETLDSNNTIAADTDFRLSGDITDFTNYRDSHNVVSCRVWQLAV